MASQNQSPDWVFCCAGSASSGFIADQLPKAGGNQASEYEKHAHEWMMDQNYLGSVNVVRALINTSMKTPSSGPTQLNQEDSSKISGILPSQRSHLPSRIILCGSVLSFLGMIGYSAYVGSKYALRGLADCLRSELKPLGIQVQLYFPGNMDTPGYEQENMGKPAITKEIEGASSLVTAEQAAQDMIAGTLTNRFYFTNDLLGELARVSTHGGAPRPNLMFEVVDFH